MEKTESSNGYFEYQDKDLPGATPLYLNSSALKRAHCRRAFAMTWRGFAPPEDKESQDRLDIGSAVHKFAEAFAHTGDITEGIRVAAAKYPGVERKILIAAASSRSQIFLPPPITINNKLAVEFTFRIPWYSFMWNGVLYQLIICGTIDYISYDRGAVRIYDYKTSQTRMRDYALKKYEHSSQFAFYQWVLWKYAARLGIPLELANDIRAGKISSQVVPVLINTPGSPWVIGPVRSLTTHMFEEYEAHLYKLVFQTLIPAYLQGEEAPADGMVNDSCQYCLFKSFCYGTSGAAQAKTLAEYPVKQYNPTDRED